MINVSSYWTTGDKISEVQTLLRQLDKPKYIKVLSEMWLIKTTVWEKLRSKIKLDWLV